MTTGSAEETIVNAQIVELIKGISDVASQTKFNDKAVLGASNTISIQTGSTSADKITFSTYDVKALTKTAILIGDTDGTVTTLTAVDDAIKEIGTKRSEIGGVQSRLESSAKLNDIMNVNTESAYSRIMDADVAKENLNLLRAETLQNASLTMMAQAANMQASMVSKLLGFI